jgi:hypothetical protein
MAISGLQVMAVAAMADWGATDDAHRAIGTYQALQSSGGAGCMRERATVQFRMPSLKGSRKDCAQICVGAGFARDPCFSILHSTLSAISYAR